MHSHALCTLVVIAVLNKLRHDSEFQSTLFSQASQCSKLSAKVRYGTLTFKLVTTTTKHMSTGAQRAAKSRAKKAATIEAALAQSALSRNYTTLTPHRASHLVDKNSRTIMKLSQLLAIYNTPGASEDDSRGVVSERIDRYKQRIARRLTKLAKVRVA